MAIICGAVAVDITQTNMIIERELGIILQYTSIKKIRLILIRVLTTCLALVVGLRFPPSTKMNRELVLNARAFFVFDSTCELSKNQFTFFFTGSRATVVKSRLIS